MFVILASQNPRAALFSWQIKIKQIYLSLRFYYLYGLFVVCTYYLKWFVSVLLPGDSPNWMCNTSFETVVQCGKRWISEEREVMRITCKPHRSQALRKSSRKHSENIYLCCSFLFEWQSSVTSCRLLSFCCSFYA